MNKCIRIIPRIDIKGPNVVKVIHLEGLRVLGKPEQFAQFYYEQGADELFYQDVVASLYDRNHLEDIINKTAKKIFIPLTVGGGLRTIDDIKSVLRAGADKVALNTAAIDNPNIIKEAVKIFGSSTIVIAIEAIRQEDGRYLAFTHNGRDCAAIDAYEWALKVEELGAGEIIVTSVDKEGTGQGFDMELTKTIAEDVAIPVIAHGGAGNVDHLFEVIQKGKVDAVALASIFHYEYINNVKTLHEYEEEGNIDFLRSGKNFSKVDAMSISKVKESLMAKGIECRYSKIKVDERL